MPNVLELERYIDAFGPNFRLYVDGTFKLSWHNWVLKAAFRLQKVNVTAAFGGFELECSCKKFWHHKSCSHRAFIMRMLNVKQGPGVLASGRRAPSHGRKKAARPALQRQPDEAVMHSEGKAKAKTKARGIHKKKKRS